MSKFRNLLVLCAALMLSVSVCASQAKVVTKHHKAPIAKVVKAKTAKVRVNINKASLKTLRTVRGIGPKRAAAIVSYREKHGAFKSIYDLNKVKGKKYGFSKKFIKNIAKKITV